MLYVQCLDFIRRSNSKSLLIQGTRSSMLSISWSQIYQETKGFAYVLQTKLLGRGRKTLPGLFSFRLQMIPLNPAWVEDMNVFPWILGQRNSKYSESASKLSFFHKSCLLVSKAVIQQEGTEKDHKKWLFKGKSWSIETKGIPSCLACLIFMILLFSMEPALPQKKPLS